MVGLQDVIFVRMYAHGIKNKEVPYNNTFETAPKEWINNLNIQSLNWDDKTWEKNLKGTTLKRIKPWMWRRNIKANLGNI